MKTIKYLLDKIYPLFEKLFTFEVFAYLAVGGANTLLNIALFILAYHFILPQSGVEAFAYEFESYTIALVIAFLLTIPTGYWLSKYFAFNNTEVGKKNLIQLFKYFLVVLQGLFTDYILMVGLIENIGMHPSLAKITTTIIVVSANFLLQKYFTFKAKLINNEI